MDVDKPEDGFDTNSRIFKEPPEDERGHRHDGRMGYDLNEAEEHVDALEEAIEWCINTEAIVNFGNYVYIKVKKGNRMVMHGAPTFLEAVEDIAEGKL